MNQPDVIILDHLVTLPNKKYKCAHNQLNEYNSDRVDPKIRCKLGSLNNRLTHQYNINNHLKKTNEEFQKKINELTILVDKYKKTIVENDKNKNPMIKASEIWKQLSIDQKIKLKIIGEKHGIKNNWCYLVKLVSANKYNIEIFNE